MAALNSNTIDVINELEYLRTGALNAFVHRLVITSIAMAACLQTIRDFRGLHATWLFIAATVTGFLGPMAYCIYSECITQRNISILIENLNISGIIQEHSSTLIKCLDPSLSYMFCLPILAVGVVCAAYRIFNQLPLHYNMGLAAYHANPHAFDFMNDQLSILFNKIDPFNKYLYFKNGTKVSVKELSNLYKPFRLFCDVNNGFDIDNVNDHPAFLKFLASKDKFDDLFILIKLGANKQDCENAVAAETAVKTTELNNADFINFPASKSLTWLAAKAASTKYTDQELLTIDLLNETQSKIVHESRKYEKFTF